MTISYGIIAYNIDTEGTIRFLFIQRRYSFSYNAFLRGHYKESDAKYLKSIARRLTPLERHKLLYRDFKSLWDNLWVFSNNNPMYNKHMIKARTKFNKTRNSGLLKSIFDTIEPEWNEPEWGFPKGKKFYGESEDVAARREFLEETGIPEEHIKFISEKELCPLCEEYIGDNNVCYKHIYYFAKSCSTIGYMDPTNLTQACEVGKVIWVTSEEATKLFRPYHNARKNVFNTISDHLTFQKVRQNGSRKLGVVG
jgi:8-oxo-dGTP pyrophosphatase MutT (NUDIX family)